MKYIVFFLAAAFLFTLCTDALSVTQTRPALHGEEKMLPARTLVETPRMLADGQRYAPKPTETIVVILVEFPADTVDEDTTDIIDTCDAVSFDADHDSAYYDGKILSEIAGSRSMDQYWDECSLGRMDIAGVVLGPYTMPHCMKYYGWHNGDVVDDGWDDDAGNVDSTDCSGITLTGTCRLVSDAVVAADPDIDFCDYDTDADGNVDHVMVVHAGQGEEGGVGPDWCLWSYFYWGLPYGPYDVDPNSCPAGVNVTSGLIVPEYYDDIDKFPLGTFCHEFSHSIGNPDLYDPSAGAANAPDADDYPVNDWCLMDHGSWCGATGTAELPSHLLGWNKVGSGWVNVTVVPPTKDTTAYTIYDLETACPALQGNDGQVLKIKDPNGGDDFWYIEARHIREAGTYFDKLDSDWSDWTGHGGPDSMDCGLIVTHIQSENIHIVNLTNDATDGYDYLTQMPSCPDSPWPYEVWVEDPGCDDSTTVDYDEWWYPWEVKAGAAYADSSADDPHYMWDETMYSNANCTRTASSIDCFGRKITKVYVEATSDCASQMTARIYVPGWVPVLQVQDPVHFCHEWYCLHHDGSSGGWTFEGGKPVVTSPFEDRMSLKWSATVPTTAKSSPVVTNTELEVAPGDVVHGLVLTSSADGNVYCNSAEDGRPLWTAPLGVLMRSTPCAVDTLYGRDGVSVVLNRVYVNATDGRLYYINLLSGAVEGYWQAPAGHLLEGAPRIGMAENPGVPGEFAPLVFVGTTGGLICALEATSPTDRWQYSVGSGLNCPVSMGRVLMPSEEGANLLDPGQQPGVDAIFFGDAVGNIHCRTAYYGYPMWSRDIGNQIAASPAVCDSVTQQGTSWQSDETVVAATGDGKVYALDATTGAELWVYDTGSTSAIYSSPTVAVDRAHNWGMIWVESTGGTIYCLHLGAPKGGSRLIWSYTSGQGTASSPGVVLPYGMLPMSFDSVGLPIYPPECATGDPERDGIVYVGCGGGGGGGRLLALDAADGSLVWDYDLPNPVGSSPAPTLGGLYISQDRLYCFVPDEAAGVEVEVAADPALDLRVRPNPSTSGTVMEFAVPVASRVTLRVYDVRGRLVRSVFDGVRVAGAYRMEWAGKDCAGAEAAAGIYFARLDVGELSAVKKVVLVR
jgi:M6 family metalloprotease-like protein